MVTLSFAKSIVVLAVFIDCLLSSNGRSSETTSVSMFTFISPMYAGIITFLDACTTLSSPNLNLVEVGLSSISFELSFERLSM